jgi:hypothetical protein
MKPLAQFDPLMLEAYINDITPFYRVNDKILYGVNSKGETFAVYWLPERQKKVKPRFAPGCMDICGQNLHRPHLTCRVCRYRKIADRKLPNVVPVKIYVLSMGTNRRFERLQAWLVKKLLAVVEYLALWGEQKK